jgi:hypothetical protein
VVSGAEACFPTGGGEGREKADLEDGTYIVCVMCLSVCL